MLDQRQKKETHVHTLPLPQATFCYFDILQGYSRFTFRSIFLPSDGFFPSLPTRPPVIKWKHWIRIWTGKFCYLLLDSLVNCQDFIFPVFWRICLGFPFGIRCLHRKQALLFYGYLSSTYVKVPEKQCKEKILNYHKRESEYIVCQGI